MAKVTAAELVAFAKSKLGTPYVYGMKGEVMTLAKYNYLKSLYGDYVWDSDKSKVGKVCCDCSGLISWATGIIRSSQGYHDTARKVNPISSIAKAPIGAAVWKKGHIGIYIGNGEYIAEDGSAYGCRKNKLSRADFTHWFEISDVEYEEEKEMVEKAKIIVDGKEYTVERILKDGTNYIKIRDLAAALGYEVGNQGNTAVLKKK
ncbi:C40 family peptidase [Anaerotignum lactatifermentans]|uniref:C40 family peptidase n=1 Tax=Anaerotignum lactatifermentans TaxID=160404 RepID=A0ABS2GAG9_9FIRM|nr:NlpC/P60 family protein [Anaerotignum lactatifermentans]MBM6828455.1 C40 family peptidase [Anaerotignum lactatifermentans]MBM6877862.1 C40 family peptidase [Anaerotignum lactatifermentans]MBM6950038.1 C40 family peptidase [Anaerotignum lactatifermentans]